MNKCVGLQVFSDGRYVGGKGAAAFVVAVVTDCNGYLSTKIIGAKGLFMSAAKSAFHAEATALDEATEFLARLTQQQR